MPVDRTVTLRTAEKLLRVGKLAAAIAEYAKVVKESPHDWDTGILLASLHVRTGAADTAVEQYRSIAAALATAGEHARAAGVYEKVLALRPGDEDTLKQLAGVCAKSGDKAGACAHLLRIADRRASRNDVAGAIEVLEEAAALEGAGGDISRRVFDLCLQSGDTKRARAHVTSARDCRLLATALQQAGQDAEARELLREVVRRDPSDLAAAALLVGTFVREGDAASAAELLTPALVGHDQDARLAAVEIFMRGGRTDTALEMATLLLTDAPAAAEHIARLACAAASRAADPAFALADLATTRWTQEGHWDLAAVALDEFSAAAPDYAPALVRLIEVGVDGGLDATVTRAQELLVDAYLAHGAVAEALAIAQDLAERDPQNPGYAAQLERARMMSGAEAGSAHAQGTRPEAVVARAG